MKIEEGKVASTKPLREISVGDCFKLENSYYIKTAWFISDTSYKCVDLYTGGTTSISEFIEVYPVDATIVINKVGVIDDTSE